MGVVRYLHTLTAPLQHCSEERIKTTRGQQKENTLCRLVRHRYYLLTFTQLMFSTAVGILRGTVKLIGAEI